MERKCPIAAIREEIRQSTKLQAWCNGPKLGPFMRVLVGRKCLRAVATPATPDDLEVAGRPMMRVRPWRSLRTKQPAKIRRLTRIVPGTNGGTDVVSPRCQAGPH